MRLCVGLVLLLSMPIVASTQPRESERRFGIRVNQDLYPQDSPRKTLDSLIRVIEKERFDYLAANLIDPAFVDEQLRITYPSYEKAAREQVLRENLDQKGFNQQFIRERIRDLATQANFDYLVQRIKSKFSSDPESLRELKKVARDGEIQEGDPAIVRLKDVKDRAIVLRKIGDRWFVENRMSEE